MPGWSSQQQEMTLHTCEHSSQAAATAQEKKKAQCRQRLQELNTLQQCFPPTQCRKKPFEPACTRTRRSTKGELAQSRIKHEPLTAVKAVTNTTQRATTQQGKKHTAVLSLVQKVAGRVNNNNSNNRERQWDLGGKGARSPQGNAVSALPSESIALDTSTCTDEQERPATRQLGLNLCRRHFCCRAFLCTCWTQKRTAWQEGVHPENALFFVPLFCCNSKPNKQKGNQWKCVG